MSEQAEGPGWWLASDGKWYPPVEPPAAAPAPSEPAPVWDGTRWVGRDPAGNEQVWDGTNWVSPASPAPVPAPAPAPAPATPKKRSTGLVLALAALVLIVLAAAGVFVVRSRGSNDAKQAIDRSVPAAGDDTDPRSKLTLTDQTVVIRGGAAVVRTVSADHASFTLDGSAAGVADLAPGKVMLIAGVDAAKVTKVDQQGNDRVITTEPASVGDVIRDGEVSWNDAAPDASKAIMFVGPPIVDTDTTTGTTPKDITPGLRGMGGPSDTGEQAGAPMVALTGPPGVLRDGQSEITAKVLGWEVSMQPQVSGSNVDLTLQAKKGVGGKGESDDKSGGAEADTGSLEMGVTVTIHAENLAPSGHITMSGGEVSSAALHTTMQGYAEAEASAKTPDAGQYPKSILVRIPIAYEWPVYVYGVPFYVSVQSNFSIQPSLSTKESGVSTKIHVDYSGESGYTFKEGAASTDGSEVTVPQPGNPFDKTDATPSPGALAMVFAAQAPRVGVGVGTSAFLIGFKAGVYIDLVNSLGLTVAPGTAMLPCRSIVWNWVVHGGGEWKAKVGSTEVGAEHAVELKKGDKTWIQPEIQGCQPK